jgi:large subunit ribosomal protein L10
LAISKEKKKEIADQYGDWLQKSKACVITEYLGMTVKDMDDLRARVREAGGEFHVVKNTLLKRVLNDNGMELDDQHFVDTTAVGFAFEDAPALAKAIADFAKESDFLKIKAGYLDKRLMDVGEVNALANVPPLPVVRASLLGTIMAPASKLARMIAEPGRQVAALLKAYSEVETVN